MVRVYEKVTDCGYTLLAEVERATKLVRDLALGNKIIDVKTVDDSIVYSGTSHIEFVRNDDGVLLEWGNG